MAQFPVVPSGRMLKPFPQSSSRSQSAGLGGGCQDRSWMSQRTSSPVARQAMFFVGVWNCSSLTVLNGAAAVIAVVAEDSVGAETTVVDVGVSDVGAAGAPVVDVATAPASGPSDEQPTTNMTAQSSAGADRIMRTLRRGTRCHARTDRCSRPPPSRVKFGTQRLDESAGRTNCGQHDRLPSSAHAAHQSSEPVLLVETHEEERVIHAVQALAADSAVLRRERKVVVYSLTRGLHEPHGTGTAVAPDKALSQAAKVTEPTIFVFFDLHHSLGAGPRGAEPGTIRAVRDVAEHFKNGPVPSTLIIVAPSLPIDLEKAVTVVDLPLPGIDEIEQVLEEIIVPNRSSITINLKAGERHRLVQAALGLTRSEAENAFARAIVSDGVLDAAAIELVLDEKRQTIRKSGLLEFIPPEGSLDDVGGLENLKRWLGKRNSSWLGEASEWSIPFPKGILITGVPGCGKSLTAKCTSSFWSMPLLRLDIGRVWDGKGPTVHRARSPTGLRHGGGWTSGGLGGPRGSGRRSRRRRAWRPSPRGRWRG